jgi:serine/threonine protein kinase
MVGAGTERTNTPARGSSGAANGGSTPPGSAAAPRPPPAIPDHELLGCIGRGSYGEVWLARNILGTYCAVKIVFRTTFDSDRPYEREFEGLKKFEPVSRAHESQVALLHVGRNDYEGYFYHIMELADDQRTDQQIDPGRYEPKTLRSELKARQRLPFEECVRIGLALTTALEHLHKHGLIHRDIKPSNIIFVNGRPKLADIGLVATLDATCSFVGTEGYLPPEGPGTSQADLYSLGKVLYEMSTGKDRRDFPELPLDLDSAEEEKGVMEFNAVVVKACKPDARDRYQSASQMREDLLLPLAGKSVRRTHAMERRLALMTRVGVGAVAVMVLGAFPYYLAIKETRLARANEKKALTEAAKSETVSSFLQSLLRGVDPTVTPGRDTTLLREILRQATRRIGRELQGQPEVQAQLYLTIGGTYWRLGALTNAATMMRKAVLLRSFALGERHPAVGGALANLGAILYDESDWRGAEAKEREAVAIQRQLVGNERTNLATTLSNLGLTLQTQGKFAEAEQVSKEALSIRKQVLGENSPDVGMTINNLAMLQFQRGDFAGAETNFAAALNLFRRHLPAEHPFIALLENNQAEILKDKGELERAIAVHRKTLEARRKLYPGGHQDVARSLNQLAALLVAQGDLNEAESNLQEARGIEERLHLGKHQYAADSLDTLAVLREKQGDLSDAESYHQQALALQTELSGAESLDVAESRRALGVLAAVRGDLPTAEETLSQALQATRRVEGDMHLGLVPVLRQLAWVQGRVGETEAAATNCGKASAIASRSEVYGVVALTGSLCDLAGLLQRQGRFAEAEPLLLEMAEYLQRDVTVSNSLRHRSLECIARFYEAWDRSQPEQGKHLRAAEWRTQLAALNQRSNEK